METNTILIIVGSIVAGLIIGVVITKILEKNNASKLVKNAKKEAASILKEANHEGESLKKDKILQAKEKFIELKSEHEKVILHVYYASNAEVLKTSHPDFQFFETYH